jgi:NADH-quinone oxidoreductase subunit C
LAEEIVEKLKQETGPENILEFKIPRPRRIFVTVKPEAFKKAVKYLAKELGFTHISTITALDNREQIEILYHLNDGKTALNLRVKTSRDKPTVPTITDIIPGASVYEREIHDILGIAVEGHPNLKPIILPEGWPEGLYPLRKDVPIEKILQKLEEKKNV